MLAQSSTIPGLLRRRNILLQTKGSQRQGWPNILEFVFKNNFNIYVSMYYILMLVILHMFYDLPMIMLYALTPRDMRNVVVATV